VGDDMRSFGLGITPEVGKYKHYGRKYYPPVWDNKKIG